MVAEPHKIVPSEKTVKLLVQYENNIEKTNLSRWKESYKELKTEISYNKYLKAAAETINMTFGLFLVAFIVFINVITQSLLSLGYLFFAIILIALSLNFFKDIES